MRWVQIWDFIVGQFGQKWSFLPKIKKKHGLLYAFSVKSWQPIKTDFIICHWLWNGVLSNYKTWFWVIFGSICQKIMILAQMKKNSGPPYTLLKDVSPFIISAYISLIMKWGVTLIWDLALGHIWVNLSKNHDFYTKKKKKEKEKARGYCMHFLLKSISLFLREKWFKSSARALMWLLVQCTDLNHFSSNKTGGCINLIHARQKNKIVCSCLWKKYKNINNFTSEKMDQSMWRSCARSCNKFPSRILGAVQRRVCTTLTALTRARFFKISWFPCAQYVMEKNNKKR